MGGAQHAAGTNEGGGKTSNWLPIQLQHSDRRAHAEVMKFPEATSDSHREPQYSRRTVHTRAPPVMSEVLYNSGSNNGFAEATNGARCNIRVRELATKAAVHTKCFTHLRRAGIP